MNIAKELLSLFFVSISLVGCVSSQPQYSETQENIVITETVGRPFFKKYDKSLVQPYTGIWAPGSTVEQLVKAFNEFDRKRPVAIGNKEGTFEIQPSDKNNFDSVARIPYGNGRLDVYMMRGGVLRSSLYFPIDGAPIGEELKYIIHTIKWNIGDIPEPTSVYIF